LQEKAEHDRYKTNVLRVSYQSVRAYGGKFMLMLSLVKHVP